MYICSPVRISSVYDYICDWLLSCDCHVTESLLKQAESLGKSSKTHCPLTQRLMAVSRHTLTISLFLSLLLTTNSVLLSMCADIYPSFLWKYLHVLASEESFAVKNGTSHLLPKLIMKLMKYLVYQN